MTRSSQQISANILEFDDDFERTLRRKREQPEPNPPSSSSEAESEFEEEEVMAADNRTIKELSASGLANAAPLCIQYPLAAQGKTNEFELKSSLLHHIPKYPGLSMEDPNKHLKEFEVVCLSMTPINVDGNILMMKVFPFSLVEKAEDWLYELAPGTVTYWESMKKAFLEKFFPTSRVILLRKKISGIQQSQGKSFPAYYERFKALVASCPQHQMKEELLLQYFYEGLLPIERQMLDASAGGALVDKTPMAAKTLIANRALNAQQYEGLGQRDPPRDGVITLTSSGGSHNNLNNKANFESPLGSSKSHLSHLKPIHKLPNKLQAITLRSGKELGDHSKVSNQGHQEDNKLMQEEEKDEEVTARKEKTMPQPPIAPLPCPTPKVSHNSTQSSSIPLNVPFPSRFMQAKNDEEEKDILETFRKVHVNIPLLDAIKQIPKYAKFLKKLCTTRKRIREKEVVHVSENVSALLQRKLPPKCKDPGSFTIPCVIGNTRFDHAMLDLGASINVMPYSVYASMNLGELKNDGVIIQLADRSNAYPKGVLEDVLVQVDHLIFPADFYVLDMEDSVHSPSSPLLLGRPFMKTAQTKIDVAKGAVTMAFGGDMINFKVFESIENTNDVRSCCAIDVIKSKRQECSTPIKKIAFQTINKEGIGVKHKDYMATTLKPPNLAESTPHAFVDCAAASLPNIGKPPIPISIPISTNRLLPSLVQVPNRMQGGGEVYIDFWKHKAPIKRDYYPLPFIEPMYEYFEEH
ncbi:unnamed protein product [Malus baccata var. baccata]